MAVKRLPEAKSRLGGTADDRAELVVAMLVDVLAAVVQAGLTPLVVTLIRASPRWPTMPGR